MEDKKEWKTEEKSDIEIRDLSVTFQDGGEMIHAMEDVSAYFPSGSVTGLIGESGSGKSLLGMSILGLLSGQARVEGSCMYKGMDLYRLPEKEMQKIRGKEIALIPQNPTESLNPIRRTKSLPIPGGMSFSADLAFQIRTGSTALTHSS